MTTSKFVGTWKLVSSEFRRSDGKVIHPFGEDAMGMLVYDAIGHMSAHVIHPDRPNFTSGDMLKGTPEEIKAAFEGALSYFGTYEVSKQEGEVAPEIRTVV